MAFTKIKMQHDKVLIKPDGDIDREGRIVFSHSYTSNTGTVLAVGSGRYNKKNKKIPTTLKPGDRVYFPWTVGKSITFDQEYRIISESDILGIVE